MAKLLSSLDTGTKIKFGKHSVGTESPQSIVWVIADKSHDIYGYPANSVILVTEKIIDLRAYDATEAKIANGNKNYGLSNIHQWLNSAAGAGNWYSATHSGDAPPNSSNVEYNTPYSDRPGFLYNFTENERNELLTVTLPLQVGSDVSGNITAKVFLPSLNEIVGSNIVADGTQRFDYFSQSNKRIGYLTSQAFNNTLSTSKPDYISYGWFYWTRNSYETYEDIVYGISDKGDKKGQHPNYGYVGVRPMVVLSGSARVTDSADSDGTYTLQANAAPNAPTNLRANTNPIYTTKPCTFQWDGSIDPEGDSITYKVHTYYDGVEVANTDVGTATTYTISSVKSGVSTIGISVEAIDYRGRNSALSSITKNVLTNAIPTISGSNTNMGLVDEEFTYSYVVNDNDGGTVTVKEYIDNIVIRSYVATLGTTNNIPMTGETWLKLANGLHTLTIIATDGIDSTTRTINFTKNATTLVVQKKEPFPSDTQPKSLMVTVVKVIPTEAIFKVEACNNGYDTTPTWEDITTRVVQGRIYDFTNSTKTASKWGVNIRVTVDRNGGEGACYISEIGGNFE